MFSFFFSLFIYRRFVCGYPWCVSYPALPSGCRNIVFLRNCGLRLKFHHLSPCFKYEFCSSYFSFFPFSRTRILISFCSLLFCFFFLLFPLSHSSLPPFFHTHRTKFRGARQDFTDQKDTTTRFTVFVIDFFFFSKFQKPADCSRVYIEFKKKKLKIRLQSKKKN